MIEKNKNKKEKIVLGYARGYKKVADNTPKVEAKPEYARKRVIRTGRYNNLILIILMLTVVVIVVFLVFAVYYFLQGSKLAELAGVHVISNMQKAAGEIWQSQNTNPPGYENWQVYRNKTFALMYPENWKLCDNGELSVKKYNERKVYGVFDYLVFSVVFREIENPDNLAIQEVVASRIVSAKSLSDTEENGVRILKTGDIDQGNGMVTRYAFWKLKDKILEARATYYRPNEYSTDEDFEKIIKSVKFIK